MPRSAVGKVPPAMKVQLAKLFGSGSREATATSRTPAQWKRTLRALLLELDRYRRANLRTDQVHELMLDSGLFAADKSLEEEDFWPGYVEGLVRFALLLMGDYPDHRRRKSGRKKAEHYRLTLLRTPIFHQDYEQQYRLIHIAARLKLPGIPKPMWKVLEPLYALHGTHVSARQIVEWYRATYPDAYAKLF
jgi:hypothetical protein